MLNGLIEKLRFDEADPRFELLENERGEPRAFGGFPGAKKARRAGSLKGRKAKAPQTRLFEGISRSADKNERCFRALFNAEVNPDVVFRRFETAFGGRALIIYMTGMADSNTISEFVLKPLMNAKARDSIGRPDLFSAVNGLVQLGEAELVSSTKEIERAILEGRSALFFDGERKAALLETRGFEKRSVSTAENERIVRGPQEGFTESMRTNITLVRRIVRTADLAASFRDAGGRNGTKLALLYRRGYTNETLIREIEHRLDMIDAQLVSGTGVIEQLIEDAPLSPLPQTLATERPDRVASFLMNGAAAIIAEGSPYAIVMPATAAALLSSPEDSYMRRPLGSIMRIVRYLGVFLSLLLPGYFVAVAMYHQGLLSTEVLSTIVKSRQMVFEPLPFEMILLLFVFQLIREAGMRVPGSVGQAIGVIGGLILGQAAVSANLASTVILIVVALSGLGNLCIPDYSTQIAASYFRLGFVIAAWMGGLLGLTSALLLFFAYMANLKSFGVPFLSPIAPKTIKTRGIILRGALKRGGRGDDYLNSSADAGR